MWKQYIIDSSDQLDTEEDFTDTLLRTLKDNNISQIVILSQDEQYIEFLGYTI